MCLITSDNSRPMCSTVHIFCIENVWVINESFMITLLWHAFAVVRTRSLSNDHLFLYLHTQSGASMSLTTSDNSRTMCYVLNCTHVLY